jgi:membrane protease YdiL (CAAX protease family)
MADFYFFPLYCSLSEEGNYLFLAKIFNNSIISMRKLNLITTLTLKVFSTSSLTRHDGKKELDKIRILLMNKFFLENSLSTGLVVGCILTYLPLFFSEQLLILTVLYGVYISYLVMTGQKVSVIHLLNISYILCQFLFNILNFYGVQLGYSAVLIVFVMYYVMYFSSEKYPSITKLFFMAPLPKISYAYILLSCCTLIIYSYLYPHAAMQFKLELEPLKGLNYSVLSVAGIAFALFNAFWEETVYRGFYYEGFKPYAFLSWVMPQLVFSLLHYQSGFPKGIVGLFLTFVFGLMMQYIRIRSKSLVPCIITHSICDSTIFILVILDL